MKLPRKITEKLEGSAAGKRLLEDERFRMMLTAALSLLVNLLYALYHGIWGIRNRSLWFTTMCAYYIIFSVMRFSAILCESRSKTSGKDAEYLVMKLAGTLFLLLSFVLSGIIYLSLSRNLAVRRGEILMITIAAYTFVKIGMAVVRAVRHRRNPSPLITVLCCISYAEAAASVFTLRQSMLVSFGTEEGLDTHLLNALSGAAVCLFVLALGVSMIKRAEKGG